MVSLAKWLNVRLRTKWLWVRIPLLSPKLQIWCLVRAVLSAICAFIFDLFPFLYTLRNSTLKHMSLFCACLTCVFYLMSFLVAPRQPHFQWHFYFFLKKKKTSRFFAYILLWKIMLAALRCIECVTKLQRSCQQMIASFFLFAVSQLRGFSIDQVKFICWDQEIRRMSLKFLTFKQRCNNLTMFFRRF